MNNRSFKLFNNKLVRQFSLNICEHQKKSYYDCLGISPKATQGDIKSAYYKLSKEYHPDLNKDNAEAAENFRMITAAYEVLSNVKNRKLYDRGLVVGTSEEIYTSYEPVDMNIKHNSFHKHRNKPTSQKANIKATEYNIDEWTKAHYSSIFSESLNFKQSEKVNIQNNNEMESSNTYRVWAPLVVILILLPTAFLFQGIKPDYDNPIAVDEKEDAK